MTRHRYRTPPRQRPRPWWPGAALGAVPQIGLAAGLLAGGPWSRVLRTEIYTIAAALVLMLLFLCIPAARRSALGLLATTATGLAAVVAIVILR